VFLSFFPFFSDLNGSLVLFVPPSLSPLLSTAFSSQARFAVVVVVIVAAVVFPKHSFTEPERTLVVVTS